MIETDTPTTIASPLIDAPEDYATLVGRWVSETVPEIESAIHTGTLNDLLPLPQVREVLGPGLGKYYAYVAGAQTKHDAEFRRPWVSAFLEEFQQSLQQPAIFLPARPLTRLKSRLSPPPSLAVVHEGNEIVLRLDQVIFARGWGIWFYVHDDLLERLYLAALIRTAVTRLVSQIKHLGTIESLKLAGSDPTNAADWRRHSELRRLLIDVFNESELTATEVLDPPEILLSLPAIEFKGETHAHIFSDLGSPPAGCLPTTPLPGKCLVISPLGLARAALPEIAAASLKADDFWSSWDFDLDLPSIANRFFNLLDEAVQGPCLHPLGPMANLPPQIRDLIRSFPTWQAGAAQLDHWLPRVELQRRTAKRRAAATPAIAKFDDVGLVAHAFAVAVEELEAALHNGTLAQRVQDPDLQNIVGPVLTQRYSAMAAEKVPHNKEFRTNWIERLLEVFRETVQPPKRIFPAITQSPWTSQDQLPPPISVYHGPRPLILRPDQVLSARGWGTWFTFEDKELERLYTSYLISRALSGLTANIKSLWHIESTFLSGLSTLRTYVAWRSGERPGQFEHLVTDMLNEETLVARSAPLAEDMLEKTDLRVSYPGIKAKNGTRVQVSLTSNPVWHERKVEALLVPAEFIVLTPLELARTAVHPPSHPLLADFKWDDFWRELGGRQTVHDLALKIHAVFTDALSFPPRHPLGPMWHVAPILRQFIRIYAQHRAEKVANSKTERARAKYLIDVSHIYSGAYWKQKFSQTSADPEEGEQSLGD